MFQNSAADSIIRSSRENFPSDSTDLQKKYKMDCAGSTWGEALFIKLQNAFSHRRFNRHLGFKFF